MSRVLLVVGAVLIAAMACPEDLVGQEPEPTAEGLSEAVRPPIALTPAQEARAREIEGALRCPVCRSQSIRQSRSFMAEDMKRRIRELIVEGRSDEEIRAFFVERYGTWILLEPPKSGFNLAAWLLPGAAVLAGAVGLVLAARRWASRSPARRSVEPPPESPYLDRLERELEETE
ncbi:MAG TPA: cytochrome c-type biogenesis protein [Gemmatimonadota bacterium]|nr:cytochrome c-type biogenesis protein [Gemmatimonadota bacterium]